MAQGKRQQKDEMLDTICLGDGKVAVRDDMGFAFLVGGSRMASHEPHGWTQAKEDGLYRRAWQSPQSFIPPPGQKYCSACGEWRPHAYFDKDATRRDGYKYECKACSHPAAAGRMRRVRRQKAAAEGREVRAYQYQDRAAGE